MVFGFFTINRQAITESFCVNKSYPSKKCNGKCHLKKVISEGHQKQSPSQNIKEIETLQLFAIPFLVSEMNENIYTPNTPLALQNVFARLYHINVFQPPDLPV
jgi:hypothetical protein